MSDISLFGTSDVRLLVFNILLHTLFSNGTDASIVAATGPETGAPELAFLQFWEGREDVDSGNRLQRTRY